MAGGGRRAAADDRARRPRLDAGAPRAAAPSRRSRRRCNARSSGEHEPEELRMKREMLEAMTLPVVRVYTAYELVPNEFDTVEQVAEKPVARSSSRSTAGRTDGELLLDVGPTRRRRRRRRLRLAKEKDLVKGYARAASMTRWRSLCGATRSMPRSRPRSMAVRPRAARSRSRRACSQVRMALDDWKPGAVQEYVTADVSEGVPAASAIPSSSPSPADAAPRRSRRCRAHGARPRRRRRRRRRRRALLADDSSIGEVWRARRRLQRRRRLRLRREA